MRAYPRTGQIEAFRSVKTSTVAVSTATATRLDPSPDPERRRVDITPISQALFIKVVPAGSAAPAMSASDFHYKVGAAQTLTLTVGPEVSLWGLADGLGNIDAAIIEY